MRQPSRIAIYSIDEIFYPRELTELDGNLYLINEDGSTTLLNKSDIIIKTESDEIIAQINTKDGGIIILPTASINNDGILNKEDKKKLDLLPSVTAEDNGKILQVVNGKYEVVDLIIQKYYSGTSDPDSSIGDDGDIYVQLDGGT